jgi:hypothetical protein
LIPGCSCNDRVNNGFKLNSNAVFVRIAPTITFIPAEKIVIAVIIPTMV